MIKKHSNSGAPGGGEIRGVRTLVDGREHGYYRSSKPWTHFRDYLMDMFPHASLIEVREEPLVNLLRPSHGDA